jgi:hypothetical protein
MRTIAKLPPKPSASLIRELHEPIWRHVRQTVLADFRARCDSFAKGKLSATDDEMFIGLDWKRPQDVDRAMGRALPMLVARINWLADRRLEQAIVGMVEARKTGRGDTEQRLPDLRKGVPRRVRHIRRRRAVARPSQG